MLILSESQLKLAIRMITEEILSEEVAVTSADDVQNLLEYFSKNPEGVSIVDGGKNIKLECWDPDSSFVGDATTKSISLGKTAGPTFTPLELVSVDQIKVSNNKIDISLTYSEDGESSRQSIEVKDLDVIGKIVDAVYSGKPLHIKQSRLFGAAAAHLFLNGANNQTTPQTVE